MSELIELRRDPNNVHVVVEEPTEDCIMKTITYPREERQQHIQSRLQRNSAEKSNSHVEKIRKKKDVKLRNKNLKPKKKVVKKYCRFCNISCNSLNQFKDHVGTTKHKNKKEAIMKKPICYTCDREFPNHDVLNTHLKSSNHKKRSLEVMDEDS